MKQLALDFASPPQPTLDNFIAGRNGELLQNLKRLASRDAHEHCYYLWGGPGSGRSPLLKGTGVELQRKGTPATYVACTEGMRLGTGLERVDYVALDDVDRLDDEGQVAVFDLYNAL